VALSVLHMKIKIFDCQEPHIKLGYLVSTTSSVILNLGCFLPLQEGSGRDRESTKAFRKQVY
jgi:hypothetical protein